MKKIKILLLLIVFLISTVSYAQLQLKTYGITIGDWNYKTKEWDWEPMVYQEITFILEGDVITVNDVAGSVYVTYAPFNDDKYSTSWKAFDEEGLSCIIGMSKKEEYPFVIYVMYDDLIYKYFFN